MFVCIMHICIFGYTRFNIHALMILCVASFGISSAESKLNVYISTCIEKNSADTYILMYAYLYKYA